MKMHRLLTAASLVGILSVVQLPVVGMAADEPPSPKTAATKPYIEQTALDQLKRMSETLGAVKALTFETRNTVEVPAKTGQYITLFANSEIALERPNKLRARVTGEVPNFDFAYDGSTIAAFAPNNNVYSISKDRTRSTRCCPSLRKRAGFVSPRLTSSSAILMPC